MTTEHKFFPCALHRPVNLFPLFLNPYSVHNKTHEFPDRQVTVPNSEFQPKVFSCPLSLQKGRFLNFSLSKYHLIRSSFKFWHSVIKLPISSLTSIKSSLLACLSLK